MYIFYSIPPRKKAAVRRLVEPILDNRKPSSLSFSKFFSIPDTDNVDDDVVVSDIKKDMDRVLE